MDLPLGYKNTQIQSLHKSIYGLKQASHQWYSKFYQALLSFGFLQSKSDYYLFTKGTGPSFVDLLVYVDDIVIIGPSLAAIQDLAV